MSQGGEPTAEPTAEPTPGPIVVPNLRGSTPEDAVNALIDLGLEPGEQRDRFNENVPAGQVIRTDPAAGTEVDPGTIVTIFVSQGGEPTAEPTAEPTEGNTSDSQQAIDDIGAQVEGIRQLSATEPVPYREITRRQFRRMVEQSFDEENPARQVAAQEALLKRLDLIPEDADLRQMILDLYESQVAAFYDPRTGAMTLIAGDDELGVADRVFISHEYDHALQDQRWDLQKITDVDPSQADRALARLALIEGDATNVMYEWTFANLGQDDFAELSQAVTPGDQALLARMPAIIRRELEFPYLDGQSFVAALRGSGGWDAVNAAWDRLPASTEQILHPERYPSDRPVRFDMPDVAGALGRGWGTAWTQTMGELDVRVLLADGGDEGSVAGAAEGWGGDRLVSLDGPGGTWAVVWQTAWDSRGDADEFSSTVSAAIDDIDGAYAVLPRTDIVGDLRAPVLVVVASDGDTLGAVASALGVGD